MNAGSRKALIVLTLFLTALAGQAADINERTIKFGYGIAEEHPLGQGVNKFSQVVSDKSGGRIKVKGYAQNVLGSETQMISAAQGGVQEMVGTSSAPIAGIIKEFALFDFPFLFADEQQADAVLDGTVGRQLLDKLADKGLIGLCFWETGFRMVTNSRHPIAKAEDLQGLKIRTMQNPVYIEAFNTLGANAVPMPFTELYTAMETRAVDAQENPYGIIEAAKFDEVQKYLSATKHAYSPFVVMVSKKFWDKLTADEKQILQDACVEAQGYQRQLNREQNAKIVEELQNRGMEFNEIPPEEREKMQQQLKPVIDKYAKEVGEDLVKQTYAEIEKAGGQ
ncbi:MAG: TRAP transporter substrate-binding protein [Pseudomonadota bacterium]|nr:TRAP transporter substrate-binding protein [Pseudomonadota bacterium]